MGHAAAARQVMRVAVVDELVERVAELEAKIDARTKTINKQAAAMEAIANAVTEYARENAALARRIQRMEDLINRSFYFRTLVWWRELTARGQAQARPTLTITRPREPELVPDVPPVHLHQYTKTGPLHYACHVPGCTHVATLDEIAAEADFMGTQAENSTHG